MALTISNDEADRLARELAQATGESLADAVLNALRERLARTHRAQPTSARLRDEILAIGRRCASLSIRDPRSADEILGYADDGTVR